MNKQVKVDNNVYQVNYRRENNTLQVNIDDRSYNVDIKPLADGFFSLLIAGRSYDVMADNEMNNFSVLVDGVPFKVDFFDPRIRRPEDDLQQAAAIGRQIIKAPMAGQIVKLKKEIGDLVKDGDGLVVLEAMKMENELKSQAVGKVVKIMVKEKEIVSLGQDLMMIE
jgi:biotin carboxyl carrier protein